MAKKKVEGRLNEHLVAVQKRVPWAIGKLEQGMIVEARYTDLKGKSKRQILCILNPYYLGKVHAISLDKVTYQGWNRWVEATGLRRLAASPNTPIVDIPVVLMPQAPQSFYKSVLRNQFGSDIYDMADSYRTFFYGQLKGIQLVDYRFTGKVMKLWEGLA
jgi:hypothetical protein